MADDDVAALAREVSALAAHNGHMADGIDRLVDKVSVVVVNVARMEERVATLEREVKEAKDHRRRGVDTRLAWWIPIVAAIIGAAASGLVAAWAAAMP